MLKFVAQGQSRKIIGLGLSAENVCRLQAGQPIHCFGEDLGLPGLDLVIFYGETEAAMRQDLSSLIGPKTVVKGSPDDAPPESA